ncbi:MAG: hypothetical protein NT068_01315 [Candidatus Nomurabacteria bacterium]|nr:hypothetical protein [Candidatus Nomurabacteria bacterium]
MSKLNLLLVKEEKRITLLREKFAERTKVVIEHNLLATEHNKLVEELKKSKEKLQIPNLRILVIDKELQENVEPIVLNTMSVLVNLLSEKILISFLSSKTYYNEEEKKGACPTEYLERQSLLFCLLFEGLHVNFGKKPSFRESSVTVLTNEFESRAKANSMTLENFLAKTKKIINKKWSDFAEIEILASSDNVAYKIIFTPKK